MRFTVPSTVVAWVLAAVLPSFAASPSLRRDQGGSQQQRAVIAAEGVEALSLAEKRAWLQDQMLREFSDVDRAAEIESRVAQMSPERVDALVKIYQKREANLQQEAAGEQLRRLAESDAYRNARVRDYQNRLAAARGGGGPVGYAPVITWLPEGTSLGASAIVSPDRRYVRMSLQPFFSRIQRVDTFTFHNPGRGYPNYYNRGPAYYPQYYSRGNVNVRPRQPRPIVYYDGIRTRTYYPNSPNHR
jgi:hypothetical protein